MCSPGVPPSRRPKPTTCAESPDSWRIRQLKRVEKASMDFADRVITINEPIRDLLKDRGLDLSKSTVIMNSVDESLFASAARYPAEARLGGARFVMMYHGTLTH